MYGASDSRIKVCVEPVSAQKWNGTDVGDDCVKLHCAATVQSTELSVRKCQRRLVDAPGKTVCVTAAR